MERYFFCTTLVGLTLILCPEAQAQYANFDDVNAPKIQTSVGIKVPLGGKSFSEKARPRLELRYGFSYNDRAGWGGLIDEVDNRSITPNSIGLSLTSDPQLFINDSQVHLGARESLGISNTKDTLIVVGLVAGVVLLASTLSEEEKAAVRDQLDGMP